MLFGGWRNMSLVQLRPVAPHFARICQRTSQLTSQPNGQLIIPLGTGYLRKQAEIGPIWQDRDEVA